MNLPLSRCAPFAIILTTLLASTSRAAVVSKSILKTYFESGDKPTSQQFSTLIDSNIIDDRHIIGLRVYDPSIHYTPGDAVPIKRFGIGDETPLPPLDYVDPSSSTVSMEPDFAGQFGFASLLLQDSAGQTYYGFLQLRMDPSSTDSTGTPIPPAMDIQYIAYDNIPNIPVTMFAVPEPATLTLAGLAIPFILRRRRA